jgi:hypothetical protein
MGKYKMERAAMLPTLELDGYRLLSGVICNKESPDTFQIPPERTRNQLKPGQVVKLMFEYQGGGDERMWVIIVEREGPYYLGTLNNLPRVGALTVGQKVVFLPEHVIDVWDKRTQSALISGARAR